MNKIGNLQRFNINSALQNFPSIAQVLPRITGKVFSTFSSGGKMKLTFSRLDVRDCLLTLKTCSEMVIFGYAVGIFLRQSFILADAMTLFGMLLYVLGLGLAIRRL